MAKKTAAKNSTLPVLKEGEKYIHAFIGADGKGHHMILLPGDESGTWAEMMASAKKRGGDLPDRAEQAILYRDHKAEFQGDYYWAGEQVDGGDAYAWVQDFHYGGQDFYRKGYDYRCRAVRRVSIHQFR
jgi:hypothetical protein